MFRRTLLALLLLAAGMALLTAYTYSDPAPYCHYVCKNGPHAGMWCSDDVECGEPS